MPGGVCGNKPEHAKPMNQSEKQLGSAYNTETSSGKVSGTDPRSEPTTKEQLNGTQCTQQYRISGCAEPVDITNGNLQKALFQLSSGSRINTGADDAAGLAIADGLHANITALTQSARNANDGVGELQVADGSLAAVTTLLNRAVTIATEAATGTVSDPQRVALNDEFTAIKRKSTASVPRPITTAARYSERIL